MSKRLSLSTRAVLAVGLMIGFYLLALSIVVGLLLVPYAELRFANRIHLKLAAVCVIGALAILWSILPRFDRFRPPGPLLNPKQQPRLFDTLTGVANDTKQEMPSEVYLLPEINAWVAQRGGVLGLGSRRVMGLGLPLLQILSRSQLRAVLAHEFGHYYRGDTKLGPWVYKTRSAIGRTLESLSHVSSVIRAPFEWYGKTFLRITHAVSRHQELVADELAAHVAGARPLVDGLKRITGHAGAFTAYFNTEVVPALASGFLPPIAGGFERFASSTAMAAQITSSVDRQLAQGASGAYDTHPSLKERIKALENMPRGDAPSQEQPAISLLEDLSNLEKAMVRSMFGITQEKMEEIKPLNWDEVGEKVYLPNWKKTVDRYIEALAGLNPSSLPDASQNPMELARKFKIPREEELSSDQRKNYALHVLGCALALTLAGRQWKLQANLSEEISFEHDGKQIRPFQIASQLHTKEISPTDWKRQCQDLGISDFDFGDLRTSAGQDPSA